MVDFPPWLVVDPKDRGVLYEKRVWHELNNPILFPTLVTVLVEVANRRWLELGVKTRVLCVWRTEQEEKDVKARSRTHFGWRAIDCSVSKSHMDWEERLRMEINKRYPTNVRSMPRISPLDHGTAPHMHIQATRSERERWAKKAIRY